MPFSDDEYFEAIEKYDAVNKAYKSIKLICNELHKETSCSEEEIDYFLRFIAGKWLD